MYNLPESLFGEPSSAEENNAGSGGDAGASTSGTKNRHSHADLTKFSAEQLILALNDDLIRGYALQLLSKNRNMFGNLAILIWQSFGTIFILLKEITDVYPLLSKPELTEEVATRCVACDPETRMPFLQAKLPLYLYPFLNTTNKDKPHEYLRLTSLGVIGGMVKIDDKETVYFLLRTEIVPYCVQCMDVGKSLSKTVATFIIQKILMNEDGFRYCCVIADRFYAITHALETMMERLVEDPCPRLLKHIMRCYVRLSESPRACLGLQRFLPRTLNDSTVARLLREDPTTMTWLQELIRNVYERRIRPDEHGRDPKIL